MKFIFLFFLRVRENPDRSSLILQCRQNHRRKQAQLQYNSRTNSCKAKVKIQTLNLRIVQKLQKHF